MIEAFPTSAVIDRALAFGGCWIALAAAWSAASVWIERDARFVFGSGMPWSLIMAGFGAAMLPCAVVAGFAGQAFLAATLALICGTYLRLREVRVSPPHRILTAKKIRRTLQAMMRTQPGRPPDGLDAASGMPPPLGSVRIPVEPRDPAASGIGPDIREGLDATGLPRPVCEAIRWMVRQPRGLLLICGPPGSGRTTTAHALIGEIDPLLHGVATVEDSVTRRLPNVSQTAVDDAAGLTAATILGGVLRPEIHAILLDEIHGREAADAALQAAAGRTVVATLQADDAADALMKLLALGIEPETLRTAVVGVLAQRLVRMLCEECRIPCPAPPDFLRKLKRDAADELVISKRNKRGCAACSGSGYRGHGPVQELLVMDEPLRARLADRPSLRRIRDQARDSGMQTLRESAIELVVRNATGVKEIVREVP